MVLIASVPGRCIHALVTVKSKKVCKDQDLKQSEPSKPKREITNITNSQNTKRTWSSERVAVSQAVSQKVATQQSNRTKII